MAEDSNQLYLVYEMGIGNDKYRRNIEIDNIEQGDNIRDTKIMMNSRNNKPPLTYTNWKIIRGQGRNCKVIKDYSKERPKLFIDERLIEENQQKLKK